MLPSPLHRIWIFIFLFLPLTKIHATHIVGGELTMKHMQGDNFRLNLALYFDLIHGSSGALDSNVLVRIYRKRDNAQMRRLVMPLLRRAEVNYSNPACALQPDGVRTDHLFYEEDIILPEADFSDAGGYYIKWDRCCRNMTITNIVTPDGTGQVFYMEFPARRYQNQPFINSSPAQFLPITDYACRARPFSFSFGGVDPDGDSLGYSLSTPWAGFGGGGGGTGFSGQYPFDTGLSQPAPYPHVTWNTGFTDQIQIPGNPPLKVDAKTGRISMTASQVGLFVFAIECREYRRGRQIGLVRREFQILVKDCQLNSVPYISVRPANRSPLAKGDTLKIDFVNGQACIPMLVSDSLPDLEYLSMNAPALGRYGTFHDTIGRTTTGQPTFGTVYCLKACVAYQGSAVARAVVHVRDNGCPVPAYDSLTFFVKFNGLMITPTLTVADSLGHALADGQTLDVNANRTIRLQLTGTSTGDTATVRLAYASSTPMTADFIAKQGRSPVTTPWAWTPTCEDIKHGGPIRVSYRATARYCGASRTDSLALLYNLHGSIDESARFGNIVTPNGDQENDRLSWLAVHTQSGCSGDFETLDIFNRWGRKVFHTTDPEFQWPSSEVTSGIYFVVYRFGGENKNQWVEVVK